MVVRRGLDLARIRAGSLQSLRAGVLAQLFVPTAAVGAPQPDANTPILNDIANSFSRFAAYQQTAFDKGVARSSSNNDSSIMSRQVQSAINQVLGRGTGGGSSFIAALNSAFPTVVTSDGPQVIPMPSRSMVSLYQPGGSSNGTYTAGSTGSALIPANGYATVAANAYSGTLSAPQANLYREASIIANDSLRVLASLTPILPEAIPEQVEGLRALVSSEINSLVVEFGRVDEPRKERVLSYFASLRTNLTDFGRRAFLDRSIPPTTVDDEAQLAGFALLRSYVGTLRNAWDTYYNYISSSSHPSLSEQVDYASILLPVVAQVNNDFAAALDSVDYPETERRTQASRFTRLATLLSRLHIPPGSLSNITVYDLTEWIDRYASIEGPNILADSGQYGLDFISDQANQLFWVIAPVIAILKANENNTVTDSLMLVQVLSNERVRFALNTLLSQMNELANLF